MEFPVYRPKALVHVLRPSYHTEIVVERGSVLKDRQVVRDCTLC